MSKGSFARSGAGKVSKSVYARSGNIQKTVTPPAPQPSVSSNIPGSGPQGVPPATADKMGELARTGNANLRPTVVAAQTGLATYGPADRSSLARMGGQVRVAPGQFGAWAHPKDPTPKTSTQVLPPNVPSK